MRRIEEKEFSLRMLRNQPECCLRKLIHLISASKQSFVRWQIFLGKYSDRYNRSFQEQEKYKSFKIISFRARNTLYRVFCQGKSNQPCLCLPKGNSLFIYFVTYDLHLKIITNPGLFIIYQFDSLIFPHQLKLKMGGDESKTKTK